MNNEKYDEIKRYKEINQERLGETILQKCGEIAFIVEYNSYRDILVQFKNTHELVKATYQQFKNGSIQSHFSPTAYGIGIIGLEKTRNNDGMLDSYMCWSRMLQRCYSKSYKERHPTYKDCLMCKEWLYYPNFKKWYDENYYEIDNEKMHLDKDVLVKGNKVYSPENCVFVPQDINKLFTKNDANRGDCPIGVSYHKGNNIFQARCRDFSGKSVYLGEFEDKKEAFNSYKQYKENFIKQKAECYKNKIPSKLYNAMYNWVVEIND